METLEQIALRVRLGMQDEHAFDYFEFSRRLVAELAKQEPVDYVPGEWFKAKDIGEMQRFFMSRLPAIREAARQHGYAIGLHGSTRRDFDLMAMPWTDAPSDRETLAHAIQKAACGIKMKGRYSWEKKPSGRHAVSMCICWTDHANPEFKDKLSIGHIDLSVIEAAPIPTPEDVRDAARLDWVERNFFCSSWNGVVGLGSATNWRIAGDHRRAASLLKRDDFREAIDAAMTAAPACSTVESDLVEKK